MGCLRVSVGLASLGKYKELSRHLQSKRLMAKLAIHLPLNSMLISLMCFVLSCLFYLPAAVSVSTSAVMSPVTGHAAPVTINCCLTSTHYHSLNSSISVDVVLLSACAVLLLFRLFKAVQEELQVWQSVKSSGLAQQFRI